MNVRSTTIPKKYHDAFARWQETYLPDLPLLLDRWEKFFPGDARFELCAYRECDVCPHIECGEDEGKPKFQRASDMGRERCAHLLGAIRAQASTEFGSIQQHQLTLARAQEEQDQFWVLRMMAEELRHGYQMFHLLLSDDWSGVSPVSADDMVEEIFSMRTGSHVLGAFNIDFDSFVDNVVFCALIDRVGKFQLSMQKVSAYQPMAESMPQMLREEAFHLATGVVPLRRWMTSAAQGDPYITPADVQKAFNKWFPRALEMFGDERGGQTNIKYGLKPFTNLEAQDQYRAEVQKLVDDLNLRWIRARSPELDTETADEVLRAVRDRHERRGVIAPEDLLRLPDPRFFRRRGSPAFTMTGWAGEAYTDAEAYLAHLQRHLPDSYRAGRDFRFYVETLREVAGGTLSAGDAAKRMPALGRVSGICPCSRAVRWVSNGSPAASAQAS